MDIQKANSEKDDLLTTLLDLQYFEQLASVFFFISIYIIIFFSTSQTLKRSGKITYTLTYQFLDASMLSDSSPCPSELGHIGDSLGGQAFQILVGVTQDLDHGL